MHASTPAQVSSTRIDVPLTCPPEWPATFERHDFKVGGHSEYVMTGPNKEKSRGFWEFLSIDPPRAFEV